MRIAFLGVFMAMLLYPIIYYWVMGIMVPAVLMFLPGLNTETLGNFILLIIVQSTIILTVQYIVYALDILAIVVVVNMLMVASVIVADINE